MIDLYYWPTPNGHKITIFLEEADVKYRLVPVDIGKGEQFDPAFLKISPNNRMPAIVDPDGPGGEPISVFESGAILLYLAEKTGQFLPVAPRARIAAIEWLMFQMGGIGPMLGQAHHFRQYAPEKIEYAIDRYTNEAARLYGVVDRRLAAGPYLAGDTYTIADMATFPWLRYHDRQGQDLDDYPSLKLWYEAMKARPAVRRGIDVMRDSASVGTLDKEKFSVLFGDKQFAKR